MRRLINSMVIFTFVMIAGLAMEEMSGNVITHGFTKDKKRHSIDMQVLSECG